MGKIIILDENTSNQIAAGEVVERPASVVKELLENSIDAGSTSISVEIKNGGISYIRVTDNGSGIAEDDVRIAFERHATSKIRSSHDLDCISTLGFRGEALASIASVSSVELTTKVENSSHGNYIRVQGGAIKEAKHVGCPVGTTFIIKDLFYNTPARYKFLKKDTTEAGYISDIITRIAMANSGIAFKFISKNAPILHTPGNNDLRSTIFSIYGREVANSILEVNYVDTNKISIVGFAGKAEIARASRNHQSIYINGRYIKSKLISSAIDEAYKTLLMKNKHAFIVLNITVNPVCVDVNVHPTKMEVRFSEEQLIFSSVYHAITNAIFKGNLIKNFQINNKNEKMFLMGSNNTSQVKYTQSDFLNVKLNENEDRIDQYSKEPQSLKLNEKVREVTDTNNSKIAQSINEVIQKQKLQEIQKTQEFDRYKEDKEFLNAESGEVKDNKEPINIMIEEVKDNKEPINIIVEEIKSSNESLNAESGEAKNNKEFANARIIGQVFSTYILLQCVDGLIILDQHAAHERIVYEDLKSKFDQSDALAQVLLNPEVVELSASEIKFLEGEKSFFEKIGFEFEVFGNNSVILRSVPYMNNLFSVKETFLEILDYVMTSGKTDKKIVADDALYKLACKSAVKANNKLSESEINGILDGLNNIRNPYTCPHGRPALIRITKQELEKMFKRIV